MKKLTKHLVVAMAVIAFASFGSAQTTDNLQHLVDTNGSLAIGDKTFSNFDFVADGLTNFDASHIRVTASLAGDGTYYLCYAGNMSLVSGGTATASLLLNYTVSATAALISMIDQSYVGSAQPIGGAFLSIDETARDIHGLVVANSHLQGDDLSDPLAEGNDQLFVNPPLGVLDVHTGLGFGIVNGGFVSISELCQSYHQVPVPEAGTTVMLGLGLALLGIGTFRRKLRA